MLTQIWINRPRLLDQIAKAKGPLAFLDESFLAPSQWHDSFYILAAAVIPNDRLLEVRKMLVKIAGSGRWHTTEAARHEGGQRRILALNKYLATVATPVLVVVDQLAKSDRNAETGRALAMGTMLRELATEHMYLTGTVVYEKRIPGRMQTQDETLISALQAAGQEGSKLSVIGVSTKREPLLWAPDLIAWSFRQFYFESNRRYFEPLMQSAKIIYC